MSRIPKWKDIKFKSYKVKLPEFTADRFEMYLKAKSDHNKKLTAQDFFENSVIDVLKK